jgi:hypothetical protein
MSWIETYTGKAVDLLRPDPDTICVKDIAHSLALQCRFTGHVRYPYSVAQHSVLLSEWAARSGLSKEEQFLHLMHDASEAYLCDVPRPVKPLISEYRVIETRLQQVIMEKFLGPGNWHSTLCSWADTCILLDERAALLSGTNYEWDTQKTHPPLGIVVKYWEWQYAEGRFLNLFADLLAAITEQEPSTG